MSGHNASAHRVLVDAISGSADEPQSYVRSQGISGRLDKPLLTSAYSHKASFRSPVPKPIFPLKFVPVCFVVGLKKRMEVAAVKAMLNRNPGAQFALYRPDTFFWSK